MIMGEKWKKKKKGKEQEEENNVLRQPSANASHIRCPTLLIFTTTAM